MPNATKAILLIKALKLHLIIIPKTPNLPNLLSDPHKQTLILIKQLKTAIALLNNLLQDKIIEISKRPLFSPYAHNLKMRITKR